MNVLGRFVDALPERLWRPGNFFMVPGGDWHFCFGKHPRTDDTVRTIEWRGREVARGQRPERFVGHIARNRRRRPALPDRLQHQLLAVEPSRDFDLEYRPCLVVLDDGSERDFTYVCEAGKWFEHWGVDPEDDTEKPLVPIERIVVIHESPSRLPARYANAMYDAGESAMGGCVFQLRLRDGRILNCETGNAVDFLTWPSGVSPADVVELIPHAGRLEPKQARSAPIAWCLYELREKWS